MAYSFFGGIHPDDQKAATCDKAIEQLKAPAFVVIPMSQHIGVPCTPVVQVGDYVKVGQKIGAAMAAVAAPIHASISGQVTAVESRVSANGTRVMSVVIENDFENTLDESVKPVENPEMLTPKELSEVVRMAGIVGMGGATFPTQIKINSGLGKVDTVIINAAECEPYITSDHRTMLERSEQVLGGAALLCRIFGVDKVYLGIEANKANAAKLLKEEVEKTKAPVEVVVLNTRYPQGAEKQLCQSITGRQVPPGGLPATIGCAVFNLVTTCAIYRAVYEGMPVVSRVVTVSGSGVKNPTNVECPLGTPVANLLDHCGGVDEKTYKLIMGGPMMGVTLPNAKVTVGKGTNAILAFCDKEDQSVEDPTCIRCGKCVGVCPMHLQPMFMNLYATKGRLDELEAAHVMDCIECGSCSYVCPGRLHLVHRFRAAKSKIQLNARNAAAEKEAAKAAEKK